MCRVRQNCALTEFYLKSTFFTQKIPKAQQIKNCHHWQDWHGNNNFCIASKSFLRVFWIYMALDSPKHWFLTYNKGHSCKKIHLIIFLFSTLLSASIFWFIFSIFVCDTIIVYAYSLYVRYATSYVWSARLRFTSYFYILLTHRRDENLLNSSMLVSIFMIVRIHE